MEPQHPLNKVLDRVTAKLKDREGNYGDPSKMFTGIAKFMAAYTFIRFGIELDWNHHDAAKFMELLKIARIANKYTEDNSDDDIGYSLLDGVMREIEHQAQLDADKAEWPSKMYTGDEIKWTK